MTIDENQPPLISFLLVAYNQERFIREAVEGALAQTYSPLEIILADDCSSDRTFEIMTEIVSAYKGPHRFVLNRNPVNLGLVGNMNRGWELSTGDFLVVQAGDDVSVPERTARLVGRWLQSGRKTDLVVSYFEEIDESSRPTGFIKEGVLFVPDRNLPVNLWQSGATGACTGYSRRLYEKYGPVDPKVLSEDWVFSFRAWVEGGLELIPEPLVKHRILASSISQMVKNVSRIDQRQLRYAWRKKVAAGALGIAEEWLKGWRRGMWRDDQKTEQALLRLVELRQAQYGMFDAPSSQLPRAICEILKKGGLRLATGAFIRHALRVY